MHTFSALEFQGLKEVSLSLIRFWKVLHIPATTTVVAIVFLP